MVPRNKDVGYTIDCFIDTQKYFQISVCDVELSAALEERDRARHEAADTGLAKDDAVAKAREERDSAVERRTEAEKELARNRMELMQANGQLLETVRQKVELSQQLDQWQVGSMGEFSGLVLTKEGRL